MITINSDIPPVNSTLTPIHIWVFPKIWENPPNHPFVHRVWKHYFHHPFWGVYHPYFWFNTHISIKNSVSSKGLSRTVDVLFTKRWIFVDSGHIATSQDRFPQKLAFFSKRNGTPKIFREIVWLVEFFLKHLAR